MIPKHLLTVPLLLTVAVVAPHPAASSADAATADARQERTEVRRSSTTSTSTDEDGLVTIDVRIDDGGRQITLRRVGDDVVATIDGDEVASNLIRRRDGAFELLRVDGSVAHRIPLGVATMTSAARDRAFEERAIAVAELRARQAADLAAAHRMQAHRFATGVAVDASAVPPTVMIGAILESPSDDLRRFLDLGPGEATFVSGVSEGLPADRAGVRPFDVIVTVNGEGDANPTRMRALLREAQPGAEVRVGVLRRSGAEELLVRLDGYDRAALDRAVVIGRDAEDAHLQDIFTFRDRGTEVAETAANIILAPNTEVKEGVEFFVTPGIERAFGWRSELDDFLPRMVEDLRVQLSTDLTGELERAIPQMVLRVIREDDRIGELHGTVEMIEAVTADARDRIPAELQPLLDRLISVHAEVEVPARAAEQRALEFRDAGVAVGHPIDGLARMEAIEGRMARIEAMLERLLADRLGQPSPRAEPAPPASGGSIDRD